MSAAAIPVRAGDHCDIGARWRVPAADARSGGFCRPVPPEHRTAGCSAGEAKLAPADREALKKVVPDRLVAQRGDKIPMRRAVGLGNSRRKRYQALPSWRIA